jgi:hypothetical protein
MQEMTLRSRGEKELAKLFQKPREIKVKPPKRKRAKKGELSEIAVVDASDDSQIASGKSDNTGHLTDDLSMSDGLLDGGGSAADNNGSNIEINGTISISDYESETPEESTIIRPAPKSRAGQSKKTAMIIEDSE